VPIRKEKRRGYMQYVKLIDYLDRPEMIRHVDGRDVVRVEYRPDDIVYPMTVEFEDSYDYYYEDGREAHRDEHSWFVLKEREEDKVNLSKAITDVLTYATETAQRGDPTISMAAYDELIRLRHSLRK
jgi:hypothetical protein